MIHDPHDWTRATLAHNLDLARKQTARSQKHIAQFERELRVATPKQRAAVEPSKASEAWGICQGGIIAAIFMLREKGADVDG